MSAGQGDSPALVEARRTYRGEGELLFSVEDKKRYRDLRKEAARLESFLSEATSRANIASATEASLNAYEKYQLSFHRQSENLHRTGFRFGAVNEDRVKLALEIFRRVKETGDNALAIEKGSERFNSDTVFNYIYDVIDDYDPNMSKRKRNKTVKEAMEKIQKLIDEQGKVEGGFLKGDPFINKEKDIISSLKKASTADEFLSESIWRS